MSGCLRIATFQDVPVFLISQQHLRKDKTIDRLLEKERIRLKAVVTAANDYSGEGEMLSRLSLASFSFS